MTVEIVGVCDSYKGCMVHYRIRVVEEGTHSGITRVRAHLVPCTSQMMIDRNLVLVALELEELKGVVDHLTGAMIHAAEMADDGSVVLDVYDLGSGVTPFVGAGQVLSANLCRLQSRAKRERCIAPQF
jgi:hypothetical protein